MKNEKTVAVLATKKIISNDRVKFNRIIDNFFRRLFGHEEKLISIDELGVEGCFARIQKERDKLMQIKSSQDEAIAQREAKAAKDRKEVDAEFKRIKKEMEDKEKELQCKLAVLEDEKAVISAEKERCNSVCTRMEEFFA
jgi:hypothetical protein